MGNHEGSTHLAPIGLREERRDDIRYEHAADGEEHFLDALVATAHDQQPHHNAGNGHRYVLAHAEELHAGSDAGELRKRRSPAFDEHGNHGKGGQAHAELLADERR